MYTIRVFNDEALTTYDDYTVDSDPTGWAINVREAWESKWLEGTNLSYGGISPFNDNQGVFVKQNCGHRVFDASGICIHDAAGEEPGVFVGQSK